jgi:hypothetical protein
VIAAVGMFLAGCSGVGSSSGEGTHDETTGDAERVSVPESSPHITGLIAGVNDVSGTEAHSYKRILIEENPKRCFKTKSDKGCDKLYLDITEKTHILRKVGGEKTFSRARAADLEKGQRVLAWHTGVLRKSYPGQGSARVIVIDATNATSEDATRSSGLLR